MKTSIFVNIAVRDLEKSKAFFEKLGFTFNPQFTDDTAASMVINDSIYFMLLTENKFQSFIKDRAISDTHLVTEALYSLSVDSREEVDAFLDKVMVAGGSNFREPEDYGFMYARSFTDLDGHIWEVFWMDPAHVQK
ncbi:MAG TPA: VOC family protein [Patescibacteria group bacterium]|jgi:hypothetical protein|nr:VOC family protein [Patescibacteria group bacterium]